MAATSGGSPGNMASLRKTMGNRMITIDQAQSLLMRVGMSAEQTRAVVGNFKIKASSLVDFCCNEGEGPEDDAANKTQGEGALTEAALEPLRRIFLLCDVDNSGDASASEISEMLKVYSSVAPLWGLPEIATDVDELFQEADTDGDNRLTWDEFFTHVVKRMSISRRRSSVLNRAGRSMKATSTIPGCHNLQKWEVDYWQLTDVQEMSMFSQAVREWTMGSEIKLSGTLLQDFFWEVKSSYNENPYHNFKHAISTVHFAFKLVSTADLTTSLTPTELFGLAVGALCHDIEHRGYNNAFEVASRSVLALRYCDKSPLEHHHCARAFEIALRTPDNRCNIFKEFEAKTYGRMRKCIVDSIIGTDMAFHNDHVKKLSSKEDLSSDPHFVVELFLHTADISNPLMPLETATRWGKAIQAEFTAQVAAERQLGLPVSTFMDGQDDPVKAAKGSVGFIDFVITPLATPLFQLCPTLEEPQKNLAQNRSLQAKIIEDGGK